MHPLPPIFCLLLCLLPGVLAAQVSVSPADGWRSLHTERFSVQYKPEDRALAEKALAVAEQSLPQIEEFLRWKTGTHIYINVIDQQDAANGWATPLPFNHVTLYTTPPTQYGELGDYNRWMRLLIAHELTHIVHLDKGRGGPLVLRRILGRFPLLFPNAYQPKLFTEGLATWVETDRENGFGRGQSALFAAMMRAEVMRGALGLGEVQQYRSEWPMNHAYLYGVYFYQYLESVYGKQKIPEYIDNYSTNVIPFLLSGAARDTTGKNIDSLWNGYLVWLEKRFRPEIEALTAAGLTPAQRITRRGYITGRPVAFGPGQLAWVDVGLTQPSYIVMRGADGIEYRLTRAQPDARLVGVANNWLYFLQDSPCGDEQAYTDLFRVAVDATRASSAAAHALGNGLALGRAERLTQCRRYTHAGLSSDGSRLALVQSLTGKQRLVVRAVDGISEDGAGEVIRETGYDEQLAQPVWQSDNTLILASKPADEKWQLQRVNLHTKTFHALDIALPRGNQQTPFVDAASGALYFTADHTGVPEIYRHDAAGVARVTRSLTASVDPWVHQGHVYYTGYTPQGWDIFSADARTALPGDGPLLDHAAERATGMRLNWRAQDTLTGVVRDRGYSSFPSVLPRHWFPGGFSSGDAQEFGVMTNGNDALYFHNYIAGLGREFGLGKTTGMIDYLGWNHLLLGYRRDYDITGNGLAPGDENFLIERSVRREDLRGALFGTYRMAFSELTAYGGYNEARNRYRNEIPGAVTPQSDVAIATRGIGLVYASSARFLRGTSESHGRRVKLSLEQDRIEVRDVLADSSVSAGGASGDVQSLDWREFLGVGGRHVLALRAFAGRGDAGSDAFRLGDNFSMMQFALPFVHERDIALRGYANDLPVLIDVNADLFSAEWRIPLPAINRGIAGWPLGAHTGYAALFYDAGKVWGTFPNAVSAADADVFDSAGLEAVMIIDLGYSMLPLQFRLGYAQTLVDDPRVDKSTVYLTLGAAF